MNPVARVIAELRGLLHLGRGHTGDDLVAVCPPEALVARDRLQPGMELARVAEPAELGPGTLGSAVLVVVVFGRHHQVRERA